MTTARTRRAAVPPTVEADLAQVYANSPVLTSGVEKLAERVLRAIAPSPRHPVLVGPSEVGKSVAVRALARRVAALNAMGKKAPADAPRAVWQVSLRTLDAFGQKDEQPHVAFQQTLIAAAESPLRPIVYVPDLRILRAFDAQVQYALTTVLARFPVRFLGEAWPGMLAWLEEDPELASVLYAIPVDEPDEATTVDLLLARGVADRAACERAVELSQRLLPHRRLPGKAVGLLALAAREAGARKVTATRVTKTTCASLRLPPFLADSTVPFDPNAVRAALRSRVVGLDEAVDAVIDRTASFRAGLLDRGRPLGVLLLAGPAGAGRGSFARAVAEVIFGAARRLVRIPLGEYGEDWRVDQLFGQRGGPTLEARRGTLARMLAARPFTVLLFEDLEKAHPLVQKHLLGLLEGGTYVNGNEEEVSLRNALVFLSVTVEPEAFRSAGLGFGRLGFMPGAESVRRRVQELLPGELLARADRVCVCPPLAAASAQELARREVEAAIERAGLRAKSVAVSVDDEVCAHVAKGASHAHGGGSVEARSVRRAVEREVFPVVAGALLANALEKGGALRVHLREGEVAVDVTAAPAPAEGAPAAKGEGEGRAAAREKPIAHAKVKVKVKSKARARRRSVRSVARGG